MKNINPIKVLAISGILFVTSCGKNKVKPIEPTPEPPATETPVYTVPTTYDFGSNTNFTSSTQRVAMFKEMVTYVRSTHNATTNVLITSTKLKNMFSNTGSVFADANLNSSGLNLKDRTNNSFGLVAELDAIFDDAGAASQSTVAGKDGTAGKVLGPAPTTTAGTQSAYLLNANGFEFKELVEKGGMGGILYAEATRILKNIGSYDNTNSIAGFGTNMEHAWDEAFGYFAVPVTFPTTTTGIAYWGSYCNAVNGAIGSNATIMNAWLKGRAAITNKDAAGRDAARDVVIATWEKVGAARFITYMKQAKTNFANDGARNHSLTEGIGFVKSFKYNPSKTISDADIAILLGYIGNNLYQITQTNIDNAITKMAAVFNLDAAKL